MVTFKQKAIELNEDITQTASFNEYIELWSGYTEFIENIKTKYNNEIFVGEESSEIAMITQEDNYWFYAKKKIC